MPHPYADLPPYCFWRRSVAEIEPQEVDPVVHARFRIGRHDRVATAGSCFAQHIARHLAGAGFHYFVTEQADVPMEVSLTRKYNYGVFSARYGNIYTARQFLQLLKRAYGIFKPVDDVWVGNNGTLIDPYRPNIQPGGFSCEREYRLDREQHFAAVRRAVEETNVMVFTFGLTEAWVNKSDGAVYPVCPGTAAGTFDSTQHKFVNFGMVQVLGDMREALDFIRERNRGVRFILTVSPVPLVATAENRHVLVSTTYSKAVLRTVCGELEGRFDDVAYFPSYEVITGNFNRGLYYESDLREVTEAGVSHVMRLFLQHYAAADEVANGEPIPHMEPDTLTRDPKDFARIMEEAAKVICDELVLDPKD